MNDDRAARTRLRRWHPGTVVVELGRGGEGALDLPPSPDCVATAWLKPGRRAASSATPLLRPLGRGEAPARVLRAARAVHAGILVLAGATPALGAAVVGAALAVAVAPLPPLPADRGGARLLGAAAGEQGGEGAAHQPLERRAAGGPAGRHGLRQGVEPLSVHVCPPSPRRVSAGWWGCGANVPRCPADRAVTARPAGWRPPGPSPPPSASARRGRPARAAARR